MVVSVVYDNIVPLCIYIVLPKENLIVTFGIWQDMAGGDREQTGLRPNQIQTLSA